MELLENGELVAGCEGGDNQNGRMVFSVLFTSEDLHEMHLSSHKAHGLPTDSGRAEIMGLTVVILYLCHLMEWYEATTGVSTSIYCDNKVAVDFAKNTDRTHPEVGRHTQY